jgi:urease accessory protein
MFDGISPSDATAAAAPSPKLQRASGSIRLGFRRAAGGSALATLYQQGSAKARFPRVPAGLPPEAVIINTAGGLTGGDHFTIDVAVAAGAAATATTQACEKVYRSPGGNAVIATTLRLEAGTRLDWLPQETILFDQGRLARQLSVDMAADATLLAAESVIFGRTARGESVSQGFWRDRWRIRRDGRLLFADCTTLEGAFADVLRRPAVLAGRCAMATIVYVAPDAASALAALRARLEASPAEAGASTRDGLLVARIVAADGAALRTTLIAALAALRGDRPMPRVWLC